MNAAFVVVPASQTTPANTPLVASGLYSSHSFLNLFLRQISIAENNFALMTTFPYGMLFDWVETNSCLIQICKGLFGQRSSTELGNEMKSSHIAIYLKLVGAMGLQRSDEAFRRQIELVDWSGERDGEPCYNLKARRKKLGRTD